MRVYLGVTLTGLAAAVRDGGFGPSPLLAYAVTPALREWYVDGDIEELEYAASSEAARESLRQLHADPDAPARRVVVAADVADSSAVPEPTAGRAAVMVQGPVPFSDVASVHVDAEEAEEAVRRAAEAVVKADAGDEDAAFVVDETFDHELLWYARQEIPDLLT